MSDLINDEKEAILRQYKVLQGSLFLIVFQEILNETDNDIATATLESLDWDLARAIEAHDIIQIDSTTLHHNPASAFFNGDDNDVEVIQPNPL